MIAFLLNVGGHVLSSRFGLLIVGLATLWAWHVYDKDQALKSARDGFVRQIELSEAQATIRELSRRAAVSNEALRTLQEKQQVLEGRAALLAEQAELRAIHNETKINPDGVVDRALLQRLRSN